MNPLWCPEYAHIHTWLNSSKRVLLLVDMCRVCRLNGPAQTYMLVYMGYYIREIVVGCH